MVKCSRTAVVALGGNALLRYDQEGAYEEQLRTSETTADFLGEEILRGKQQLVITHGNGPQVGNILLQNETGKNKGVPSMPMDACGAQSQGLIGYFLQQSLHNYFHGAGKEIPVTTLVTQCLVDRDDPAFEKPTKPVGPFYEESRAKKMQEEHGWTFKKTDKGWRRVVPSPEPVQIIEGDLVQSLLEAGAVPIVSGGGGIPVVEEGGRLKGVEAVIDKDLAAEKVAQAVEAEFFLILTDVRGVAVNYGKPDQRWLDEIGIDKAKELMQAGEFGEGSMKPKMKAAIRFVENGGARAKIASLNAAKEAMKGKAGTAIFP